MRSAHHQTKKSSHPKPAQSQSPLQKKKLLKFVDKLSRTDKSMEGISFKNIQKEKSSEEPVPEFKREIEKRFATAETNYGYNFPRKFVEKRPSSKDSDNSLENVIEYDLHTQNFKEKSLTLKLETLLDTNHKKEMLRLVPSTCRLTTSSTEPQDNPLLGFNWNKSNRAQTPTDRVTLINKKTPSLRENLNEDTITYKLLKSPNCAPQRSSKKADSSMKMKFKEEEIQESSIDKNNDLYRPKTLLRDFSPSNSINPYQKGFFYPVKGQTSARNNNQNTIKVSELIEDGSLNTLRNQAKSQNTKSCKDLKATTYKIRRQPTEENENSSNSRSGAKPKTRVQKSGRSTIDLKESLRDAGSLMSNKSHHNISSSQTLKMVKASHDLRSSRERINILNDIAPNPPQILENLSLSRKAISTKEESKSSSIYNKIQQDPSLKARLLDRLKSPKDASLKIVIDGSLTSRNNAHKDNDFKVSSKTPFKTYVSPRGNSNENYASISSQSKLLPQRTSQTKLQKASSTKNLNLETVTSTMRLLQNYKSPTSRNQVPTLSLAKLNKDIDLKENKQNYLSPTNQLQKEILPTSKDKIEVQISLKRNKALTERQYTEKSHSKSRTFLNNK